MIGSAGYAVAQSSDDAKTKREIQKLEQNKKSNAASEQDKAKNTDKSADKSSDKSDKTRGQASSSDTSKSSDTAKKDNAAPSAASDTSKSPDSAKSANDTSKPAASQSTQSSESKPSESKPSTASDTNKSQPSTASDTNKSQPSTASDTSKSQPSTASQNQSKQPSTAQQPAQNQNAATPSANTQANTAQSQPTTRVSASLQASQKTQLTQAFTKVSIKPLSNVNFSVSVGTVIPTSVTLRPVPTTVISIIPQYRGYEFFVVRDQYVIVEPRTHKIVDVIERSGGASRAEATTTKRKLNLSQKDRSYIREHSTTRSTTTTGTASRGETHITVGEDAPEAVEIEQFPADVYRTVPAVRSYRYIHSGDDIYIVEPGSRRVIEQIE
jgi:hypothetical protein